MFRNIEKSSGLLFATHDLGQKLRDTVQSMCVEVDSIEANRLLNTAPDDLKKYLIEKFGITPITLLQDKWYVDSKEVKVDVRYDQSRWIDDTSRPALVPGERIEVRVPFEGESDLFFARADTFTASPPRAVIEKNELVLRYDSPGDAPRDVRPLVDSDLKSIGEHLGWQRPMIDAHNAALSVKAEQAIQQRRARLLSQSQRVEALGIPIKLRADAPKTYAVPTVRRSAAPTLPPATTSQFRPEPIWVMEQYEQALKIVQAWH